MTDNCSTQTCAVPTGKDVHLPSKGLFYFHAGSATFVFIPERDQREFEQKANRLRQKMNDRIDVSTEHETLTQEIIAGTSAMKGTLSGYQKKYDDSKQKVDTSYKDLMQVLQDLKPISAELTGTFLDESKNAVQIVELIALAPEGYFYLHCKSKDIKRQWEIFTLDKAWLKYGERQTQSSKEKQTVPVEIDLDVLKTEIDKAVEHFKGKIPLWADEYEPALNALNLWAFEAEQYMKKLPEEGRYYDFSPDGELFKFTHKVDWEGKFERKGEPDKDKPEEVKGEVNFTIDATLN